MYLSFINILAHVAILDFFVLMSCKMSIVHILSVGFCVVCIYFTVSLKVLDWSVQVIDCWIKKSGGEFFAITTKWISGVERRRLPFTDGTFLY